MFDFFHKRPYLLYSLIAGFLVMGVYGLVVMPKNLFPDSDRPTIIVISQVPGATPNVVAATRLKAHRAGDFDAVADPPGQLDQYCRHVDRHGRIRVQKGAGTGGRGREQRRQQGARQSARRRSIPPSTPPGPMCCRWMFLRCPRPATRLTLDDVRKIAESDIKPALLRTRAIGNVEVFGGYQSAISINVDPFQGQGRRHRAWTRSAATIRALDRDVPIGFSKDADSFYTMTFYGERDRVEDLRMLPLAPNVRLGDIADLQMGAPETFLRIPRQRNAGHRRGHPARARRLGAGHQHGGPRGDRKTESRAIPTSVFNWPTPSEP